MAELIQVSFSILNLPFTLLLLLVLLYWSIVMFGALDISFLDFDLDADLDTDVDVSADVNLDADVDAGADIDGGTELGWVQSLLAFVNLGTVPFMIVISFFALFLWVGSVLGNHYFNAADSGWTALLVFLPNFGISLLATKLITAPLKKMFASMQKEERERRVIVGKVGIAITSVESNRLGQIEVPTSGAPLLLNAKTFGGRPINKGQQAVVVEFNETENLYYIQPFES